MPACVRTVHKVEALMVESFGRAASGDDVLGLHSAFLAAGARTVIGSLWTVAEDFAENLIVDFFRRIKNGERSAAALKAAQETIRRQSPRPYDWAGFTLFGDPS
jgi:CHAT domain-containing protein